MKAEDVRAELAELDGLLDRYDSLTPEEKARLDVLSDNNERVLREMTGGALDLLLVALSELTPEDLEALESAASVPVEE